MSSNIYDIEDPLMWASTVRKAALDMLHAGGLSGGGEPYYRFVHNFLKNDKKIIFIRPHKTASTTVNTILDSTFPHMSPNAIRNLMTAEEWNNAYKFCFVRNTYDRLVSWFLHVAYNQKSTQAPVHQVALQYKKYKKNGKNTHEDQIEAFREWIQEGAPTFQAEIAQTTDALQHIPNNFLDQSEWICYDNGDIFMDFIGHVENFKSDMSTILKNIGFESVPAALSQIENKNKDRSAYRDYYDGNCVKVVQEVFAKEINYFDFKF